jgi:hypothetical protein
MFAGTGQPAAMSASAADRDRFRAEFQRCLPPCCRDLASTDLQLLATVRNAPVTWWHEPAAELCVTGDNDIAVRH